MGTFRDFITDNCIRIMEDLRLPRPVFFGFTVKRFASFFETNVYIKEDNDGTIHVYAYFPPAFDDERYCECNPIINHQEAFGWNCHAFIDGLGSSFIRVGDSSDEPNCLFYQSFTAGIVGTLESYIRNKERLDYDAQENGLYCCK